MSLSINKTYRIISHSGEGLNLSTAGYEQAYAGCNVCLCSHDINVSSQKWIFKRISNYFRLVSDINNDYGLNYQSNNGNCVINTVSGNDATTAVTFVTIDANKNIYKIKQKDYDLYLTATIGKSDGNNVSWAASNTSDTQEWMFVNTSSEVDYERILNSYADQYANKYWNTGVTETQLTSSTSWGLSNSSTGTDNSFYNASQCRGFVCFLIYKLTGDIFRNTNIENASDGYTSGSGWITHNKNLSSLILKPGDIVYTSSHAAMVCEINGSTVTVLECWGSYSSKIVVGSFNGGSEGNLSSMSSLLNKATVVVTAP